MCNFRSALVARYEDEILLYWEFNEDSHYTLMESLVEKRGEPLEACPIEVTCGKIKIDLEEYYIRTWMRSYIKEHEEEIKDIEIQSLEWMKTHKLMVLNIRRTVGFRVPKGSKIQDIYASGSENLTFEGPVVVQYLKVSYTKGTAIPKGSKIKILDAEDSENLTLDDDCEIEVLFAKGSSGMVIPSTCKIDRVYPK